MDVLFWGPRIYNSIKDRLGVDFALPISASILSFPNELGESLLEKLRQASIGDGLGL